MVEPQALIATCRLVQCNILVGPATTGERLYFQTIQPFMF